MTEQQRRYREDEERRQRRGNDEREDRYPYGGDRHVTPGDARSQGSYRGPSGDDEWGGQARHREWDERDGGRSHRYETERDRRVGWQGSGSVGYGAAGPGQARRFDQSGADWRPWTGDTSRVNATWGTGGREFGNARPWGDKNADRGGTTSYAGRGPKDYRRSDERIREELSDRLTDDDRVDASEISIQVQDGTVTLTGTAGDREQKRRAEDVAESVSGVQDVINNIRVERLTIGKKGGTGNVLGIEEADEGYPKGSQKPTSVPS